MAAAQTVSVVITTYYRNEWLRRAIESALAQRHTPQEVIVVDGSGEANARSVAAEYDVTYYAQDANRGVVADRNRGIAAATGDYVHLLDDDDRLTPDALSKKVSRMDATDAGVVYCGLQRERDDGKVLLPDEDARGAVLELALSMQQPPIFPSTMLIEADVLDDCTPLPERYSGAGDTALVIELARRTDFEFVPEPLLVRGEADFSLAYTWESVRARRLLLEEYADLYERSPDARKKALAGSYELEGQVRLAERAWSPAATLAFARAVYHGGPRLDRIGSLVASLFGRRVWRVARDAFVRLSG